MALNKENTMFVYIWKTPKGTPFYVGFTRARNRTNPLNAGGRNWLCKQKLVEIGAERVIIELRPVASVEEGTALECKLIAEIGRIQTNNGPLTNLTSGGDGAHKRTPEHIEKLRVAMRNPAHPARSPEARAKISKRMKSPDVQVLFRGDANPAKRLEVREKIKAKWADPEYRAMMVAKKIGKPIHSEKERQRRKERLLDPTNPMREYHKVLNTDPAIAAKRAATLRSPEQRKRQSDAMKAYWERRKNDG
jgi:hypothetical protein